MHKPTQEELDIYNAKILATLVSTSYPIYPTFIDMSGTTIGELYVDKYADRNRHKKSYFWCTCSCGNKIIMSGRSLRGKSHCSCGCYNREITSIRNQNSVTHGDSDKNSKHHNLYIVWSKMRDRCNNPNAINYENYGARGIKVCPEWDNKKDGYINFKAWALENGYDQGLSIDRKDNNFGYDPSNCRWVNYKVQNNNQRKTVFATVGRYTLPIAIWAEITNNDKNLIYRRIKSGWSYKDAIFTPSSGKKGECIGIIEIPEEYEIYNKYDEFIKSGKIIEDDSTFLTIKTMAV